VRLAISGVQERSAVSSSVTLELRRSLKAFKGSLNVLVLVTSGAPSVIVAVTSSLPILSGDVLLALEVMRGRWIRRVYQDRSVVEMTEEFAIRRKMQYKVVSEVSEILALR
jgi:hypothetical protein